MSLIRSDLANHFLYHGYERALMALHEAKRKGRMVIFRLPEKEGFASRNIDDVAEKATEWAGDGSEVYFHVHLHDVAYGENRSRGKRETVTAAIGLAVDIDGRGPGCNKETSKLCPTVEDALSLVEKFDNRYRPLLAGVVIKSGYGCYPMILFDKPWIIEGPADQEFLEALSRRFHYAMACIAREQGWNDAVKFCDLSKMLRLPGTINRKAPAHPRAVRVVGWMPDHFSYSPAELDRLLPVIEDGNPQGRACRGL